MKTIAVSLQKGGVGKTSLAVSLAAELALSGATLLIDADPQGSASAWLALESLDYELADVLSNTTLLEKTIIKTETKGLSLLPTAGLGGSLLDFSDGKKDDLFCFRRLIDVIATQGYFYAVIDIAPSWGVLEKAAMLAADEVLTPILGDTLSMDGLQIFADNLQTLRRRMKTENPQYNKIIINAIDKRIKQHGEVLTAIQENAKSNFNVYSIPVDPAFRLAHRKHLPLQSLTAVKANTRTAISVIAEAIK